MNDQHRLPAHVVATGRRGVASARQALAATKPAPLTKKVTR